MLGENFVIIVVWANVPPHSAVHVNCDVQVPSGSGPPVLADAPLGNPKTTTRPRPTASKRSARKRSARGTPDPLSSGRGRPIRLFMLNNNAARQAGTQRSRRMEVRCRCLGQPSHRCPQKWH